MTSTPAISPLISASRHSVREGNTGNIQELVLCDYHQEALHREHYSCLEDMLFLLQSGITVLKVRSSSDIRIQHSFTLEKLRTYEGPMSFLKCLFSAYSLNHLSVLILTEALTEFQEFLNATSYPTPLMALDELYLNVVTLDTGNLNQISNLGPSLRLLHIESAYEDIADTVLCPSNNFTWRFANMEYLAIFGLTSSTFGGSTIIDNSLTTLFYEWQRNEGVNLKQLRFDSWFIWNWSIGVGWECLQDRVCTMEERVYHTD
ncbi:hypothetical protein AAF712_012375 [Marasmius tenuissimus]|uniref:Uncharacterized protein n=1 Tax=Marasmius tenuissimus TaxID=585030 RepID=A0ABR2ZGW5_9AGAR